MRLKHDASHSCRHMGMSMTAGGNLGTYQDPWMTISRPSLENFSGSCASFNHVL